MNIPLKMLFAFIINQVSLKKKSKKFLVLSGIKAISKCEVNLTKGFQSTTFTSNILYRVQ